MRRCARWAGRPKASRECRSARPTACCRHPSRSDDGYVFVVTEGGYAKRTAVDQYRGQSRGGLGIKVAKLNDDRGVLAGGLIVSEDDEVLVVLASGKVVRSAVAEVPAKGRDTMGVVFARPDDDDRIIAIARNGERGLAEQQRPPTDQESGRRAAPEASSEIPRGEY